MAPACTLEFTFSMDCLDIVLPFEEEMMGIDKSWDDFHHRSYFLLDLHEVESNLSSHSSIVDVHTILNHLSLAQIFSKGNMSIISKFFLVNISWNPNIIENVFIRAECSPEEIQIYTDLFKELCDVFTCYYEEIPRIDPSIV